MAISQLSLTNFRGLRSTTLDFHPEINFITGDNGSGKTSLLESIYVVCQARSFQTHQLKHCINNSSDRLLLFSKFKNYKVGISRSDKKLEIKINGDSVKKRSELATRTPINVINADTFDLITGSPERRRQYIDWCLFHVEQKFPASWASFRHALKQRNAILKSRKDLSMIDYWDSHLIEASLVIQSYRQKYTKLIRDYLETESISLLKEVDPVFEYEQGWPKGKSLKEGMDEVRQKDIKTGFTNRGVHRDNLVISTNGIPVSQVLSRGQAKRLCVAMQIALLKMVKKYSSLPIILLVDDVGSELDMKAQETVFNHLVEMGVQLFITNINSSIPVPLQDKEFKMFHVEHGTISPRKNS